LERYEGGDDELIGVGAKHVQFKNYCDNNSFSGNFSKYEALDISPYQVHRSKGEHKHAIFVLAVELVASLAAQSNPLEIKSNPIGHKQT
jgi:hypothetical protein